MNIQGKNSDSDFCVDLSFIIPHRGRIKYLIDTVHSIIRQDYSQEKLEIIIVSQESDLRYEDIESEIDENIGVPIAVLNESSTHTISTLRNIGADKAIGRYIAFIDADIDLSSNWVKEMVLLLNSNPERIIVSAIQQSLADATWLENIRCALSNIKYDVNLEYLPGRNLLMLKENFSAIGGFPDSLSTCEDYYFTNKASNRGDLFYSSNSSYIHLGEDKSLKVLFEKEIWRGYSNIDSVYGRSISLAEIPSFIIPIGVLSSLVFCVIATLSLMPVLALSMLIAMQLPVLIYGFRLKRHAPDKVLWPGVMLFYNIYFIARGIGMVKERCNSGFSYLSRRA